MEYPKHFEMHIDLYIVFANPRLIFPSVQENASALAVLPSFLETLGLKIEKGEQEKEQIELI